MNIGDTLWYVQRGRNMFEAECPDCAGRRAHHVVLGNGEEVDIACDTCDHGYHGSTGIVKVWEDKAIVKSGTVTSMTMKADGPSEVTVSVWFDGMRPDESGYSDRHLSAGEWYVTLAAAEAAAAAATEVYLERASREKHDRNKSWAWHIQYYREQIRRAKRDTEYAEKMLAYAQEKAK